MLIFIFYQDFTCHQNDDEYHELPTGKCISKILVLLNSKHWQVSLCKW